MDLQGPISFRAAQASGAYGNASGPRARAGQPDTRPGSSAAQQGSIAADGTINPPFAERRDHVAVSLSALVSGKVESPVGRGEGFEQAARANPARPAQSVAAPAQATGAYAMYTRAADRVEVATAVSLGRTLDARA
jgi:hypothetical protein